MSYSGGGYSGGGGYSTTSYGAQGGADGGGFMENGYGSQGGSQNSPGGGKTYGKDTLRPCTIKQLIDAEQPHPDAEFKIDDTEITQVTFVGQINSISPQPTNITYKIDDGTGLIEVKQWVDTDKETVGKEDLQEGKYVRVWGRLRTFGNKRHVPAHVVRAITDENEINMHLLEATYVHLYLTRGPPESLSGGGGAAGGDGMFVEQDGHSGGNSAHRLPNSVSATGRKVFQHLLDSPQTMEGLHVNNLAAALGIPVNDVFKAGDELLSMGLIYPTVDDETFAVLQVN